MRVVGRIFLIVLPILFLIGFIRFAAVYDYQGSFLPSYEGLLEKLSTFPDVLEYWNDLRRVWVDYPFESGFDFLSVGAIAIWRALKIWSVPFQIVGWFFTLLFV